MQIRENTFATLSYTLRVAGKIEDQSPEGQPLQFPYGKGLLLPKFEEAIKGLGKGDKFAFKLEPKDGYGEVTLDAIVKLPISAFLVDGKVEEGLLTVGNQIPMATPDGQTMLGRVTAVGLDSATLDFNHPMAGAAKITIAEVEELVEPGQLDPNEIHIPGIMIQRIFQGEKFEKRIEQRTVRTKE